MPQEPWGRSRAAPDAEEVRRAVDEAFTEDPALREALVPKGEGLGLDSLWDALWRWFVDLIGSIDALRLESPALYWLVLFGLLAVLALLLGHIAWSLRGAFAGQRRYRNEQLGADQAGERVRDHQDLLREARQRAAAGDYRDAVHTLLLSLLALLEERRLLRVAGSWTIREILLRLSRGPAVAGQLSAFGRDVERATYGPDDPTAADWQRLEEATLDLAQGLTTLDGEEARA